MGGRRMIRDIRRAVREGRLPTRFRSADVVAACPQWATSSCRTFPSKHRVGNTYHESELFVRLERGLYCLKEDA